MRLRLSRALGIVALAVLAGLTGCARTTPKAQAQPSDKTPDRPPVVMFLGDSYTAGIDGTTPDQTYASETARLLGWQVIVGGHGGTGFVAPGRVGETFDQLFDEQLAWRPAPDMIIVVGGHNDWPYPVGVVKVAAQQLLHKIISRWPTTHVVLIGPMWGNGHPKAQAWSIRDTLKTVAGEYHVPFIDPLGEKWITGDRQSHTGNAPEYILPDGTHPTPQGHRYFATRLIADLRRLGLAEPVLGRPADTPAPSRHR